MEASHLGADESTLTGESVAVEKATAPVAADARLGDRHSMLFKGTSLTRGSGVGVVVATGVATELGHISKLVEEAEPETSPLERRLAKLSSQLVWAVIALTLIIAAVGVIEGKNTFLMVEAAIALAVAAIPEGLPIVATLALARGMLRMARQNALIERLSAVETLGATTVILTDKTGTLTENRMTVRRLWVPSGEIEIDGAGDATQFGNDPQIASLLEVAVLCNDATLGDAGEDGTGDPMELALLRAGHLAGLTRHALLQHSRIVRKEAFDTASKMMATVHSRGDQFLYAVKGAPEAVLEASARVIAEDDEIEFDDKTRGEWAEHIELLGHHGLRVLACAMKRIREADAGPYEELTFLGLIGLEDPARADVPQAIRDCHTAGIRVVMVTGDHAVTARSIGLAVGLGDAAGRVVEGRQLGALANGGQWRPAQGRHLRAREPGREARPGARLSVRRRDRRHDRRRRQRRAGAETG